MFKLPFRLSLISGACACILIHAQPASAISLIQAYQAALQNDPQHRSAKADNDLGKQYEVIGRAGLLPQAQYGYSLTRNKGESVSPPNLFGVTRSNLDYLSTSKSVSVRQTLFNLDSYARFKQGVVQTKYSAAQFDARSKELMSRVLTAYVEAKFAEDQLNLFKAQRDSYAEQRKLNQRLFEKGEGTRTDMLETQAKLDVAEAVILEAEDNLFNARNTLTAIIGMDITSLDNLREGAEYSYLIDGDFESWRSITTANNPELAAAQLSVEISEQEIAKSRAGHAPRLDLSANYNHGKSETITTLQQDNNVRSVGVQLVIPIYSGGYVNATSKQAVAQKEKALADLENVRNRVMNELRKQYNGLKSSVAKIAALQNSVSSATQLVEATKQSVKGGVRINLDLLGAQQQLVSTKRDLAQARYSYLSSFVKLKVTAGTANLDDLQTVASFFSAD
ncbi:TolC family outer membrane protein [Undibacterium flavidum]|uniref:TolC family outer membrane protein n=1 Tax=Undibacterium flavidum TaxID=2762297 RepID=A0ABR6Y8Y8_9BURK|nr:TolC family outer membrane protein [Undibacterium flavidum]MBC3873044.1 TolC family outer membrane protein [Undibacterium flavidum]